MSDFDTEQQAVPADTGDIPAASPTAAAPSVPAPDAENLIGDDTPESQGAGNKPKGGFQRRISELTRQQRELREELARERAEREALQQRASSSDDEPTRDKFDSWDDYERAHVRYVARQEIQAQTQQMREAESSRIREQQASELRDEWESRLDAARDEHDDIDEYVDVVGERIGPMMAMAIQSSEVGPGLVRYLGQNPKELDRILNLPAVAAVRELGRLETRLQARPRASNAPAPTSGVKTTTAPANALRDDSDIGSWMKARNAQLRS
jgi:hypothetical protein